MNAQSCLDELRRIRDVVFATVGADGAPRARIIDIMLAEPGRLIFCTARGKHFYQELVARPEVAVTGMNDHWQSIRLTGRATRLPEADQRAWIDHIFEANPSMNEVYPGDARYILEAFAIDRGALEFFDLGRSPIVRESFAFGGDTPEAKGFFITDGCIGCDTCAGLCPQQAIDAGTPYVIRQPNCLHCGLCFENCPVEAIARREAV
ncbi:4Fe-4S binding protein [Pseudoramibacter sp. HA2172]|uniref:pyridoxamine 5'-phosphate oxidase family protein n=1 Tax=Pseudoramibacter faecis TaxID=3108534 RepID=UPI002E765423|nr:4Fe-4S binding protein [Pseudoramibacter sp. HA2172]